MRALILFSLLFVTLLARTRYHLIEVEDKNKEKEIGRDDEEKENDHDGGINVEETVHPIRRNVFRFIKSQIIRCKINQLLKPNFSAHLGTKTRL